MVRRLQSERYTKLANLSGRVLLATVIESERVSIESFFFTLCFVLEMTCSGFVAGGFVAVRRGADFFVPLGAFYLWRSTRPTLAGRIILLENDHDLGRGS